MNPEIWDIVIVGAGAAGLFASLRAKELSPELKVLIVERAPKPLRKVSISGGGRCNVTHDCNDLDDLLSAYPRGGHRLEAILARFMPWNTVDWFQERGVKLKTEQDGRMFPVTDNSQTIIDCLLNQAHNSGIELRCNVRIDNITGRQGSYTLKTPNSSLQAKKILLATGGASKAIEWLKSFGHEPIEDIPSLFTFCVQDPLIQDLQGLSVSDVALTLNSEPEYHSRGPFLITHWGISGPGVLKLSAFAARTLYKLDYKAALGCDFLPHIDCQELEETLQQLSSAKQVSNNCPFPQIPKRLWSRFVSQAQIGPSQSWQQLGTQKLKKLAQTLKELELQVSGKGVFKEEFVTSGGVPLHEVDVYTMESRKSPGIFLAGELLNVDGITGGFNFQNAWATGYIAGEGMSS